MSMNFDSFAYTMEKRCPECGARLNLSRVEDVTVSEHMAHCLAAGSRTASGR